MWLFIATIKLNRSFVYFYELFCSRKTCSPVSKFKKPKQLNHFNDDNYLTPSGKGYRNKMCYWGKCSILEKLKIYYRKIFLSDTFFEMECEIKTIVQRAHVTPVRNDSLSN